MDPMIVCHSLWNLFKNMKHHCLRSQHNIYALLTGLMNYNTQHLLLIINGHNPWLHFQHWETCLSTVCETFGLGRINHDYKIRFHLFKNISYSSLKNKSVSVCRKYLLHIIHKSLIKIYVSLGIKLSMHINW
jgi:hypothetical protein